MMAYIWKKTTRRIADAKLAAAAWECPSISPVVVVVVTPDSLMARSTATTSWRE
jgi:hypothetical protein